MMRKTVCSGNDRLNCKSQLNYQLINLIGEKILMTFMPHLRSVDKGAFLLVRVGVNSPIRANYMVFNSLRHYVLKALIL